MKNNLLMNFSIDRENKKIKVEKEFAASLSDVWQAWTESETLDKWWAPKPWKARTKSMDFREGGYWLYSMIGPEGEVHWSRVDYLKITPMKSYSAKDAFCDENGNIDPAEPRSAWNNTFTEASNTTRVSIEIQFDELSHLEATLEMGFKEGFTAGLENLEELLGQ